MTTVTTVARELDEMCEQIYAFQVKNSDESGLSLLGRFFGATETAELYEIIAEIHKRVALAHQQITTVVTDTYESQPALAALTTISNTFSASSLVVQWVHSGSRTLIPQNLTALRSVSGQLRLQYPLPRLSNEEQAELLIETDSLIEFVKLKDLTEPRIDIQRALMLDGLQLFRTRLKRLKWVGTNSTLEALRLFLGTASALEEMALGSETGETIVEKAKGFWAKAAVLYGVASKAYTTGKFFVTAWTELGELLKSPEAQRLFLLAGQQAQQLLTSAHEGQKALPGPG